MQLTLQAVPKDGKLVLNLPPEFDGQLVTVQITDSEPASEASSSRLTKSEIDVQIERIRDSLVGIVIDNEDLRRENLYEDRF